MYETSDSQALTREPQFLRQSLYFFIENLIADKLGISQSYISRLEKKIIAKLRKEINKMT